jgi:membrane associated rhomboid family serine protease
MFIIPLTGKTSWRSPPIITIGIILLNCLVFFLFQLDETQRHYETSEYYFVSGLGSIEVPHYILYLENGRSEPIASFATGDLDEDTMVRFYLELERDYQFIKKLKNEEIITPSNPYFAQWKLLRTGYDHKQEQIISLKYGFRPAYKSVLTSITYMFLHGSMGHLIGNMIFLWIVGSMLEMGLGRWLFSTLYVAGGLIAAWFFGLINTASTIPVVGASGAVAGLMGAFAVLYGRKNVKIFYSLGFYFNYLKIPVIILLPIWIGNELFQLFFGNDRYVAYVAHIGGLIGGAVFGFISLKFPAVINREMFDKPSVDEISPLMEKALQHIAELDMEGGRELLEHILEKDPENVDALTHLFNIYKLDPENYKYHETAKKLIFQLSRSYSTYETAHKIYREYIRHTRHPRLSPQLYVQLSSIFSTTGHIENAVTILTLLLKKVPNSPGIPTALLKLATAYGEKGMVQKGQKCLQLICNKYPESTEARVARESLQH